MAITLFDLEVSASSPATTKGLSNDSKNQLFKRPEVETSKPKEAGVITRAALEEDQASEVLELDEISQAYSELIERADSILDGLKERLSDLTFVFNPEADPILAEAIGRVFQNSPGNITYRMYLAALRLDKDLAVEIGESESGFVR